MDELFPYLRKIRPGDKRHVRNEIPGKCNIFEQEYDCELKVGDVMVKYSLSQFVYLFLNNFIVQIVLNEAICRSLKKLKDLGYYYTEDSLDIVFRNYPNTLLIIKNNSSIKWTAVRFDGNCLYKQGTFPTKNYFYNNYEEKWVSEIKTIADSLMKELAYLKVDFNKLKRIEEHKTNFNIPPWLSKAMTVGGVILLKITIKSFVNSVDIPLGDSDSVTTIDIDTGDIYYTPDIDSGDYFSNYPYMNTGSLSFQGKQILNIVGGGLQTIKVDDIGIPPGHATEQVLYKGVWHKIVNHKVKLDGHWWKVPR